MEPIVSSGESIRIEHKHSSHVRLWLGLVALMIVLAGGWFFFMRAETAKIASGPEGYLKPVPSDAQLKSRLSDAQYHVTRENGTETAFQNMYWDNLRPGIYVDVITGEPLFSSKDKFNSNTGRPSFTKPISAERLVQKHDTSFNMDRIEIRSVRSDSHLGHLFKDGPPPAGDRYAINSAALKFIPVENMPGQGYGDFVIYVTGAGAGPSPAPPNSPGK
jgi:peptide methionine sulfoxide reductase msrA/msrB